MGHQSNKLYAEKVAGAAAADEPLAALGRQRRRVGAPAARAGQLGNAGAGHPLLGCAAVRNGRSVAVGDVPRGRGAGRRGGGAVGKVGLRIYQQVDPGQVVLDEFAGFWVTCAFVGVPQRFAHGAWPTWCFTAGLYILFRLTDTLKIPPARQLEKLPWGWGILLDDIAAGVQANIVAQVIVWWLPR